MDYLSLFVGVVIGFVIGALFPSREEKTSLLEKMTSKLSLGESCHVSFCASKYNTDEDDDGGSDVDSPDCYDPIQEFRMN